MKKPAWKQAQEDYYKNNKPYFQIKPFKRIYFNTWEEYYNYIGVKFYY